METQKKRSRFEITITPETREALEQLASETDVTPSDVAREALELYFAHKGRKVRVDVPPAHRPRRRETA